MFNKGKVLVTGGAGFIGSHQVDALVHDGYKVIVVDDLSSGSVNNLNEKAILYQFDIREEEKLEELFAKERPDFVFHFAAQINVNRSVEDPIFDADVNIIGSLGLLELCVQYKVKKIIFSSTGGALYGEAEITPTTETYRTDPLSPYGIAKLCIEKYIKFYSRQFGLEYGIMRYANVYGPRQNPKGEAGVISIFIKKLQQKMSPVIHGDGHQTRDYVYVNDVVRANMASLRSSESGIYNVGTGFQTTVNEVFNYIRTAMGSSVEVKHENIFSGQRVSCLSYKKINKKLGWQPEMSLEKGIENTIEWSNEQIKAKE